MFFVIKILHSKPPAGNAFLRNNFSKKYYLFFLRSVEFSTPSTWYPISNNENIHFGFVNFTVWLSFFQCSSIPIVLRSVPHVGRICTGHRGNKKNYLFQTSLPIDHWLASMRSAGSVSFTTYSKQWETPLRQLQVWNFLKESCVALVVMTL